MPTCASGAGQVCMYDGSCCDCSLTQGYKDVLAPADPCLSFTRAQDLLPKTLLLNNAFHRGLFYKLSLSCHGTRKPHTLLQAPPESIESHSLPLLPASRLDLKSSASNPPPRSSHTAASAALPDTVSPVSSISKWASLHPSSSHSKVKPPAGHQEAATRYSPDPGGWLW